MAESGGLSEGAAVPVFPMSRGPGPHRNISDPTSCTPRRAAGSMRQQTQSDRASSDRLPCHWTITPQFTRGASCHATGSDRKQVVDGVGTLWNAGEK